MESATPFQSQPGTSQPPSKRRLFPARPKQLGRITALKHLVLHDNALSGSIPPLSGIPSLRYLQLSGNRLSGTIPPQLGAHPRNPTLHLCHLCPPTTAEPGSSSWPHSSPPPTGDHLHLSSLDVSRNRLSGGIPAELANLRFCGMVSRFAPPRSDLCSLADPVAPGGEGNQFDCPVPPLPAPFQPVACDYPKPQMSARSRSVRHLAAPPPSPFPPEPSPPPPPNISPPPPSPFPPEPSPPPPPVLSPPPSPVSPPPSPFPPEPSPPPPPEVAADVPTQQQTTVFEVGAPAPEIGYSYGAATPDPQAATLGGSSYSYGAGNANAWLAPKQASQPPPPPPPPPPLQGAVAAEFSTHESGVKQATRS